MKGFFERFRKDFELYIGSIFLSITTVLVIMNVYTRYFRSFTYHWVDEVAVGAFVWVIFLGFANAYRNNDLIGVEVLMELLPKKGRVVVDFITNIIVSVLSAAMLFFSYKYVIGSTKITAALEVSYKYIYVSVIIGFALITFYSLFYAVKGFKRIFLDDSLDDSLED